MKLGGACLLLLVALSACAAHTAQGLPHVSQCNRCMECHVGDVAPPGPAPEQRSPHAESGHTPVRRLLQQAGTEQQHAELDGPHVGASAHLQHRRHRQGLPHSRQPLRRRAYRINSRRTAMQHQAAGAHLEASSRLAQTALLSTDFGPSADEEARKNLLPNCTQCWGCNTKLTSLTTGTVAFGANYTHLLGATNAWVFRATTPRTATGMAAVKVNCIPIPKVLGGRTPVCTKGVVHSLINLLVAIDQVAADCGLSNVTPRVWVDKVDAVMPGTGYHIRWYALWQEVADGVSLESLVTKPRNITERPLLADLLVNRVNKTQLLHATLFDLLFSQCDRHAQNIFINEQGNLKLIDNERSLGYQQFVPCGVNSMLLPSTYHHAIIRLGAAFTHKEHGYNLAKGVVNPLVVLDYRCATAGGKNIGTNYPPQLKQCLRRINSIGIHKIQRRYGLDLAHATHLKIRAQDMLTRGFEWTVLHGEPQALPGKRHVVQPPCCNYTYHLAVPRCVDEWAPRLELPLGNPHTGGPWTKPDMPDPGTFVGGTHF